MKKMLIAVMLIFVTPALLFAAEYVQKDGLFKIDIPDSWRRQEISGGVLILPPNGAGIVIKYKPVIGSSTPEAIRSEISSNLEGIIEYKIKPSGGSVIENKEITVDNVYARLLYYKVFLKNELMYFIRVIFVNKGHRFTIDYGNASKTEVDKVIDLVNTLKF